jgi:hypothetical protein
MAGGAIRKESGSSKVFAGLKYDAGFVSNIGTETDGG